MRIIRISLALPVLVLTLAMLAGCGGSSKDVIGVSMPNTSTTLNAAIGDAVVAKFPEAEVQVQSADNDVSTQISHVNGFITMKAKLIVVLPTEVEALEETLVKARNAGIKVVISGASAISENAYDAITYSNEHLVGSYVALLAKHWAEDNLQGETFDTLILASDLNEDGIARSNGMMSIAEPYLKNNSGEYVDLSGNAVSEADRLPNPAYSSLVAGNSIQVKTMGLSQTGNEMISTYLTQHPDIRLVLAYMSGVSPGMSQYIIDGNYNDEDFAIFSGGVQGNELDYLIGSLSETEGTKSVFRGAVSFGGSDAAQGVADLAYKVLNGQEGVDYPKRTSETIGVWFAVGEGASAKLACLTVDAPVVEGFDPASALGSPNTVVKWPTP
jgi:ABC-type sugar transport system substrate-binding protein